MEAPVEILLDPNVAYLLLVAGMVLAVLALLAPGTGLLEVGALITLLVAGWSVYNLPIHLWALGVLLLGGFLFVLALRKPDRGAYLAIAVIALAIGSAFLFKGQGWRPAVNPVLAVVVSVLTVVFFRIAARKAMEAEQMRPAHDLDALIGAVGEAKTDVFTDGTVQVNGELWSAYSDRLIYTDSPVRVIRRDGFILEVEPTNHSGPPA
jgi:membrane-bound serine protease (ClpP class)